MSKSRVLANMLGQNSLDNKRIKDKYRIDTLLKTSRDSRIRTQTYQYSTHLDSFTPLFTLPPLSSSSSPTFHSPTLTRVSLNTLPQFRTPNPLQIKPNQIPPPPTQISHLTKYLSHQTTTMASSAPPILPTTTPQPPATIPTVASTTTTTQPPIATPAFRSFITRLHDQVKDGFSQRRPWAELLDRSAFSKPESLSDATTRVRKNYSYFRVNYLAVISAVLAFSLFSHPFSLLTLAGLLAAWAFLYLFKPSDQPLILFGRTFSDKETLGILVVFSVFTIFLTNVGSVLMSALVVGLAIVVAHGAFRVPEDLFLDDQESGVSTGFLSFLGATTANAAAAAAPRV